MEIVSIALRRNFQDFCSNIPLRSINDMFLSCGIQLGEVIPETLDNVSGERRRRVEEYYASLDWTSPRDTQQFLNVISFALVQEYVSESYKQRLRQIYKNAGFRVNGDKISLPSYGQEITSSLTTNDDTKNVEDKDKAFKIQGTKISVITRRDILDHLSCYKIEGRLELIEFLKMTWPDLDSMPSPFSKAKLASDIERHMLNFPDWDNNFLLHNCLKILECDNEIFTTFLVSCIHPLVQTDKKTVGEMLSFFNDALRPDGYVIQVASYQSGKPIYKAVTFDTSMDEYIVPRAIETLESIARRFHSVVRRLSRRYDNRPPFEIRDEYDVQDLFHALLIPFFDDIRPEEIAPSLAGGHGRIDFIIKAEQVAIEIKKTRPNLKRNALRDQLIIDIGIYKTHPQCRSFFAFIYDPDGLIDNPKGFERDLSESTSDLRVKVIIEPS